MSILVWRLLRHCGTRFVIACGSRAVGSDPSLAAIAKDGADSIRTVPFREHPLHLLARRALHRTPLVRMLEIPDIYRSWVPLATAAALSFQPEKSDILATFASPMSNHLAGLSIRRTNPEIPWIAYFGDPWVSNPMFRSGAVSRYVNRRMENAVVQSANLLVFPCEEMSRLTLNGYSTSIKTNPESSRMALKNHSTLQTLWIRIQERS